MDSSDSTASRPPTFEDRTTGTHYPSAFAMVDAYIERLRRQRSLDAPPLDATGYSQIRRGSAHLGINVLEENGLLMLLSPVTKVPAQSRESFYRKLLELSFLATADAAFAIDGKNEVVYVRVLRRLSALDYEEFEDLVQTVGQVAEEWDDVLEREFGGNPTGK